MLWAVEARVLINDNLNVQTLTGEFKIKYNKNTKNSIPNKETKNFENSVWQISTHKDFILIKNKHKQIKMAGNTFEFAGEFQIKNNKIKQLKLFIHNGKASWVIHLPIEEYLYGVLGSEVPVSWPIESLKAQAIASRTYFLFKKIQQKDENYDVRSDNLDQVFSMDLKLHESIINAVDLTRGQILVTKDEKQIFPAYFHSDCGGHTSSEKNVWRKIASLNEEVKDPFCQVASKNNWTYSINRSEFMALLHKTLLIPKDIKLQKIMPRETEENRSHVVDLIFSGNIFKRVSANDLRKLVGFDKLKSTHFKVSHYWQNIEFQGRGYGHGVGLCQWGAQRWARKGKDFEFILKHYYPNSKIKLLDDNHIELYQANLTN
jgi:SpoIID/LytB domain protein